MGLAHGAEAFPEELRTSLKDYSAIEDEATAFAKLVAAVTEKHLA